MWASTFNLAVSYNAVLCSVASRAQSGQWCSGSPLYPSSSLAWLLADSWPCSRCPKSATAALSARRHRVKTSWAGAVASHTTQKAIVKCWCTPTPQSLWSVQLATPCHYQQASKSAQRNCSAQIGVLQQTVAVTPQVQLHLQQATQRPAVHLALWRLSRQEVAQTHPVRPQLHHDRAC